MEGGQLEGATGWVPANRDLCNAKVKGAILSGFDMECVNLSSADLEDVKLCGADLEDADFQGTVLCGANLQGARRGRAATVDVVQASSLRIGAPVVFALTQARALCIDSVTLRNQCGNGHGYSHCPKRMEIYTATGPWTSVVVLTSAPKKQQTFTAAPGAPLLTGFVQVVVHDTNGLTAQITSMSLQGTAWGPAA